MKRGHGVPMNQGHILDAFKRISGLVQHTPISFSPSLSKLNDDPVYLKLEHLQTTGSFKLRGATNAVISLNDEQKARGVVGVSTGNHGRGLAYAAKQAGVRCIVCMSSLVPLNKVEGIKAHGAEVRIVGNSQDDAQVEVERLVEEDGMTMLPPFDHPDIIAGQGTLGIEMLEQFPEVETVLVPLSGGGLISGIALAIKSKKPEVKVIGISMSQGAAMIESQKAGFPVQVEEVPSLADSLGGGIGMENCYTFKMVQKLVDELIMVEEEEIERAVHHAYWKERQVIEGGAAVGIAALLSGRILKPGLCLVLLSGGNIDMRLHKRLIDEPGTTAND